MVKIRQNTICMEHIAAHLIAGLQEYFAQSGFRKAVVGISGGVDSAVTATLAVRALGSENVFGLLLPYSGLSGQENLEDARELVKILKIPSEEIDISRFAESFLELPWVREPLTKANILPRTRMMLLYAWANEHRALVLGTCNKSETLLGYETKFGDGASDIAVIGDLWKTEVWELAKYLELSEKFVTKAPSAELMANHTDEGEMGFSYFYADEVLQKWERGEPLDTTDERVRNILERIRRHEHKRRMAPVLPK